MSNVKDDANALDLSESEEEEELEGERIVALNNAMANAEFCSNYVSTSKYNAITFVPKFLFGTFVLLVNYD